MKQELSLSIKEQAPIYFDAHCLARSYVNFLVGRYVWFISPPDGVCISYSDI